MPNQNIDLAAFLGNNPYYANAVPQMTAQTAAPVAQTTVPNFENYEPSYLTDGQINAMRNGNPTNIDTPSTRGLDQERFRAAPVQNVDLAAFLGNNPAYNQTPAEQPQPPATDPGGVRNPKYDGMMWLPEAELPADFYLPATPAPDPRGTRNPKYDGMTFMPENIPEDLYLPATPAPPSVTLGPPGMNYGNMNEQYFTQAPMGPMPAYQNPYVGIAGLLNR
jgi:hypothetical protein